MKSFKEFIYLTRKAGIFYSIYYLFYKVNLRFSNSGLVAIYKKTRSAWLSKIFNHLFVFQNNVVVLSGRQLCKISENRKNNQDVYLRPFSSDLDVFNQVIKNKDYLPVVEIYAQLFISLPQLIIDLGANIGLTSVYFSRFYKDAIIIAIEPFADNAAMVRINLETNKVNSYSVLQGGIWNRNTKLRLNRKFGDGKEWAINLVEDSSGEIEGYCLKELIDGCNQIVDILKIDIEGAEKKLFEDQEYAAAFLSKVKCVVIEIHDEFNCRKLIYDALKANNYFYYQVHDMTIGINKNLL